MDGPASILFGVIAVLALVLLLLVGFRARDDGKGGLAAAIAITPLCMVVLTGALRSVDMGGSQLWFIGLAAVWFITMALTLFALVSYVRQTKERSAAIAAFFLFPVLWIYLGVMQVTLWLGT
ncbi:MAG: hypothetical protein AAGP08_14745 [Pseudomonadota bacterium]